MGKQVRKITKIEERRGTGSACVTAGTMEAVVNLHILCMNLGPAVNLIV